MQTLIFCGVVIVAVIAVVAYKKLKNKKPESGISSRAGGNGKQRTR